ncbi:MAG TPA: S-layer homology domain-containing protein, partial [Thermoanaerobaculia bacterium]|nr:S-layer homology domain-containing protein [Thermoanaerobaculia bacterium]
GGNFCPTFANTRAQMSVFIWKAQFGSTPPPACTGLFNDVPCPGGFAVDYIEGLANEGVTAGCGGGNFCPDANITNGQMSVFLGKAFKIPHL